MQADIQLLPKRPKGKFKFINSREIEFVTNYFEISLNSQKASLFQYSLDIDLPDDSLQMLSKVVKSLKKALCQKIEFISHRGKMIWGFKDSKIPIVVQAKFNFREKDYEFQCIIKRTKQLLVSDLLNSTNTQNRAKILQILNINVKDRLKSMKMQQLGRGKYYNSKEFGKDVLRQAQLSVWRGFKLSVVSINAAPLIQIDICSRVLRSNNLLEVFKDSTKDFINQNFKDSIVITDYGNRRTFKIQEILFNKTPKSEFYSEKQHKKLTFQQYFQQAYGLQVTDMKQPLLKVVGKIQKQIKNGKIQQVPTYIYLIPEFVFLTGMSNDARTNHRVMQQLAQYTKLSPQERMEDIEKFRKDFNEKTSGMFEIKHNKRMRGNILQQPTIKLSENKLQQCKNGTINIKNEIKSPAEFKDWAIVYSLGKKPQYDNDDANFLKQHIFTASKTFGIVVRQPRLIKVSGRNQQNWKSKILQDLKQNGLAQIYVIFIQKNQEDIYKQLKKFFTNDLKKLSQFVKRKTVNAKSKHPLSCASKIILQMNAKIGSPLWEIKTKTVMGQKKNFMYGAISISKGKGSCTLGFVGTTNGNCTSIYSDSKIGIKKQEQIPSAILEEIFINWARTYCKANNKKAPQTIILYRQGLSDQQIKLFSKTQVDCLHKMVQTIGIKTKTQNYSPNLIYIVVNKKINSRMYYSGQKSRNMKYVPQISNPASGSILMEQMSIDNAYDFYLVPQCVTQGTCTPTHFQIAYDSTFKIPIESIVQFTFEQCFNYYNWPGAVRVPACLQAANKLSKLIGESIRANIEDSELKTKPHFL